MNLLLPHVSLRRSRKNPVSADMDIHISRSPSRSLVLARRKTRPPPLQIIPELSENVLDIDECSNYSPPTARPAHPFPPPESDTSRVTLSAYTFSIDHTLLMLGDEPLRSPALSASSSTSDGASSEGAPSTPRTSEGEDGNDCILPTPRLCPRRISIRPLCITKTRTLISPDDEDTHTFEKEEEEATSLAVTNEQPEPPVEAEVAAEVAEEAEQDFYAHEFEDFITLSPVVPSLICPARRDSLILIAEALPTATDAPEPKPRGRSRHSKPLPLLPPVTPPLSSFPSISPLPLVQTTAQNAVVRRKRNIPSLSNSSPSESRPLPRVAVPQDVEDCVFPEETLDISSREPIAIQQIHDGEDASVCSPSSFAYTTPAVIHPLAPATSETLLSRMYGEVTLPRASTDSDAPRSSTDSTLSFATSSSSNTPISPFSFPNSPSFEGPELEPTQGLRSRWSSSTLASLAVESPRTPTLFSPFKSVARRVLLPPRKVPPQTPLDISPPRLSKNKQSPPRTTSPLNSLGKHLRRQKSRSSTSSAGTSSSECDSREGSPSGLKRKPIPASMFLRAT